MRYDAMRLLCFFDLPMESSLDIREYTRFRKFMIRNGFLMIQKSVYTKLALNPTTANAIMDNIKKHKPAKGLVQMLCITEKQFSKMEFVVGEFEATVLDSTDRVVFL